MNEIDETSVDESPTSIRSKGPQPFKRFFICLIEDVLSAEAPSSGDTDTVEAKIAAMSKALAAPFSEGSDFRTTNRDLLKRAASLTDHEIYTASNTEHLPATPLEITHRFLLSKCCEASDISDEGIAKVMPPVGVEASWVYLSTIPKGRGRGRYIRTRLSDLEDFVTPLAGMLISGQTQTPITAGSEWVTELIRAWDIMVDNKGAKMGAKITKLNEADAMTRPARGGEVRKMAGSGATSPEVIETPCLPRDL